MQEKVSLPGAHSPSFQPCHHTSTGSRNGRPASLHKTANDRGPGASSSSALDRGGDAPCHYISYLTLDRGGDRAYVEIVNDSGNSSHLARHPPFAIPAPNPAVLRASAYTTVGEATTLAPAAKSAAPTAVPAWLEPTRRPETALETSGWSTRDGWGEGIT